MIIITSVITIEFVDGAQAGARLDHLRQIVLDRAQARVRPVRPTQAPARDAHATCSQACQEVNHYRALAGLGPVRDNVRIERATEGHAHFYITNLRLYYGPYGLSAHRQHPDGRNFTAERFWKRMERQGYMGHPIGEIIAFEQTPIAAVSHWMETLYHRLPILHPYANEIGYAHEAHTETYDRINVLNLGATRAPDKEDGLEGIIVWPIPGAVNVEISWDGVEMPQPPAPPNGYPSGPVITANVLSIRTVEFEKPRLRDLDIGEDLDITVVTEKNDPVMKNEPNVIGIYSNDPLEPGTRYEVTVSWVNHGGETKKFAWTFTTNSKSLCSFVDQRGCRRGQGCYADMQAYKPTCAYAGTGSTGRHCFYQQDCAPGHICAGMRCRRFCDLESGKPKSCEEVCARHSIDQNTSVQVGICHD